MITNAMAAAVSGMNAQATRFLHIGNNIANSSTTGYKSGDAIFSETLALVGGKAPNGTQLQPGAGVAILGTEFDFSTGQLLDDTNDYHLSIAGDGFFPVTQGGRNFVTRSGDFSLVPNPDTVTAGFVMMRPNGAMLQGTPAIGDLATALDTIVFPTVPSTIDVSVSGTITALDIAGAVMVVTNDTIGLKDYVTPNNLTRAEGQMYIETAAASPVNATNMIEPGTSDTGFLRQRSLEQSNVDLTAEFTKMIVSQRNFQANAKTITTADEMLNTAINVKR